MAAEESKPASYFKCVRLKININISWVITNNSKKITHGLVFFNLEITVFFISSSFPGNASKVYINNKGNS